MTEQELKDQGAKLICRVGAQSRPVYDLNGDLYEKPVEMFGGVDVNQFTLQTDPMHVAWLRTWRMFRGS